MLAAARGPDLTKLNSLHLALGVGVVAFAAFSLGGKAAVRRRAPAVVGPGSRVLVMGSLAEVQVYRAFIESSLESADKVAFLYAANGRLHLDDQIISPETSAVMVLLESMAIDEVVLLGSIPGINGDEIGNTLLQRGIVFRRLLKFPAPGFGRCKAAALDGGNYLLSVETVPQDQLALALKRMIDIAVGLAGIVVTGIAYLLLTRRIRQETGGSTLFTQIRVGRNGRRFRIHKFRTMSVDAELRRAELLSRNEMAGNVFKLRNDPRVTPSGRALRRHHLDELPQFWNILRGEMSVVGTRPPTPDEVQQYHPGHWRRLSMKPGLTGFWQLKGNEQVSNFEQIVRLDCDYIDNWSLLLDLKIIVKTIMVVMLGNGW